MMSVTTHVNAEYKKALEQKLKSAKKFNKADEVKAIEKELTLLKEDRGYLLIEVDAQQDALVAYYPFDGNAKDLSGNRCHGKVHGATLTTGIRGQAYSFDGEDDYISVLNSTHPTGEVTFTYTAWVYSKKNPSRGSAIIDVGEGLNGRSGMLVLPNRSLFYVGEGNDIITPVNIPESEWTFVAITKSGRTMMFYENGSLEHKVEHGVGQNITNTDLRIGTSRGGELFYGIIDEVRIYNRELSEDEIRHLYKKDKNGDK